VTCDVGYLCANFNLPNLPVLDLGPMYSTDVRRRAVASLGKAEGHQHSAGGHGVDANKCLPPGTGVRVRDLRIFFCIFLIQTPAFYCILWLRKWALPVFLSRPLRIGGMKTFGRCCPMRPERPKIEAESRERGGILGEGQ